MNTDFYWIIELWDGEKIKVKPDPQNIGRIQNKIANGEGAITTPTQTITIKSIKSFSQSDEFYSDQLLLEGAARAFNEPELSPDGAVMCLWVKKAVPKRMWEKFYRYTPAYKIVEEGDNHIIIGWRQPIHQIDRTQVNEMSQSEILRLTQYV